MKYSELRDPSPPRQQSPPGPQPAVHQKIPVLQDRPACIGTGAAVDPPHFQHREFSSWDEALSHVNPGSWRVGGVCCSPPPTPGPDELCFLSPELAKDTADLSVSPRDYGTAPPLLHPHPSSPSPAHAHPLIPFPSPRAHVPIPTGQ